jgi:hypothetical protein
LAFAAAPAGTLSTVSKPATASDAAASDLSVLFILNFPPKESDSCVAKWKADLRRANLFAIYEPKKGK